LLHQSAISSSTLPVIREIVSCSPTRFEGDEQCLGDLLDGHPRRRLP
jgi:hypothetical protein